MSRYDKYEPKAGGFRAPLAADFDVADRNTVFGVGLDNNGRVVKGSGATGVLGVLILARAHAAGDIVDVMTDGEVVEFPGNPGTVYNSAGDGTIGTDAGVRVGHTVEGSRLVVRVVGGSA